MQEILSDEFNDPEFLEFAIENYSKMFGYINTGRINIRIHRDIERFYVVEKGKNEDILAL